MPLRKKKRKLIKQKHTEIPNTSSPPPLPSPQPLSLPPKKKTVMKKHATKKANLLASHVAAKTMFAQCDKVKQLEEEITRLHEQLQAKEQVAICYCS